MILWFMNCTTFIELIISVTLCATSIMFTFRYFRMECVYVKIIYTNSILKYQISSDTSELCIKY